MFDACKRGVVLATILILATWTLVPGKARGWSAAGHRIVANIAYDRLDPAERKHVVDVLRKHKDFDLRFKVFMAEEIPNATAEDQERWIFLQASIWPDLIRDVPKYHIGPWHYVNLTYFLSDTDAMALRDSIKPNLSAVVPSPLPTKVKKQMNCMQAINLCLRELKDPHTSDAQKALFYCWLFHLVGDTHQPLHSTALVSRARFNEAGGDHGGGGIRTKPAGNLHSFWDGLHGHEVLLKTINTRTKQILESAEVTKAADAAKGDLDVQNWIKESHQIAKDSVYSKEILAAVQAGEVDPHLPLKKVELDAPYQAKAHAIANQRVAEAGYRLAEILKTLD